MAILSCAPNFRDLGGLPAANGARLRSGMIYRSEAIHAVSTEEADCLAALGVRTVIDLRSAAERGNAPGYWPGTDVEVVGIEMSDDPRRGENIEALRADHSAAGMREFLRKGYEVFPKACAAGVRALFELAAAERTPVLVHCTAGKDRTGFLIAMLLAGLGVSFEVLLEDYRKSSNGLSADNVEGSRFAVVHRLGLPIADDALYELTTVRDEYLTTAMRVIEGEYGSIEGYLAAIGVSDSVLAGARRQLLE